MKKLSQPNSQTITGPTDRLNRPMHDLRISVIDRCNFRCTYCMPEDEFSKHYQFLESREWLTYDEIVRLTKLFVQSGVTKIRLTGGEPLLRPNLSVLIEKLSRIEGIDDLTLTTNGSLLAQYAKELKGAGLQRLTVSLDTLDSRTFGLMNGRRGSVDQVLNGIRKAQEAGFTNIKINVVVQRGVNDNSILDLVKYFKGTHHILRFIEYMDVGNCNHWNNRYVVPSKEILAMIHAVYPLCALQPNYFGEVADRYEFMDGSGEIGFISSITQPFCGSCTRVRLSTDGKIFTCLFASKGEDLRAPLRQNASDHQLLQLIARIWSNREDRYSELRSQIHSASQSSPKVEMFQIGG